MKRLAVLVGFLIVGLVAAIAPPGRPTDAQANCFSETGFCITNPAFAEYFRVRGGVRILGYPISRDFTLEGFTVQFYQRVVLQLQGDQVQRLNILDPNIMPMTRANQSVFPPPDPSLASAAPQVGSSDYPNRVVEFVRSVAPNTWNGQKVGFFDLFNTTVPVDIAFPGGVTNPGLVTLLNLEIWGLPTSQPAADPGNGGFVYQRFQRGIMHFRAEVPVTEGILVGEYLKAVMTGKNLPPDLAQDMQGSRFLGQYRPGAPNWLARPNELQNTNLNGAFEPGTGPVTAPPQPSQPTPTATPSGPTATPTATPTQTSTTTVDLQISDDLIDPGESISLTVIAHSTTGLTWIEWQGRDSNDPALDGQRYDQCDDQTDCAYVWNVTPTRSGSTDIRARARDNTGARTDWVTKRLRVREGPTVTPTPSTPTPTPGPGTPTVTPTPSLPNVRIQLSDERINLGQSIELTVIASDDTGLDWIAWKGDDTGDSALDDEQRYDCNNRKDCARTWTVKPTKSGSFDILARARQKGGARSDWVRIELKVR
ncbi:MAG: hypothetical protein IT305_17340 [Chloroflexi bacterium]|nr:hypothetical protein [Chloroflexota bacterium]